ncbi:MAG: sugar phosphate isomerase/epimerase [Chlorobi bacterium]|nr:sugar phosphate isomerase/epimerase [Chlorobiota bacterium]
MKLGFVISTQPTSFSALVYEEALEAHIAKIKKLGYDGIELAVRNPELLDIGYLTSALNRNRLTVPAIGTGQIFCEEGLSFTNPDPAIRKEAIMRIKSHINLADKLNAIVIIGLVRGKKETGITNEQSEQWLIEALRECASENKSVKLAIEPINRYETDIINTVASGLSFIEKVNMENVGLLLDTFHMNIEEPSIIQSIVLAKEYLFHFHIADSNRWYPGAGHINFTELFSTLKKNDYHGFVSAEILPLPDPDTAALKTIEYWKKL